MSIFSRKQSNSRCSLIRLVFSFGLPLLLLCAFLGRQFLDFNDIGLSNGFSHPLTGWDHLVTMLAVGIWAAQLRGRAVWMLPLAFVSVMSLGGLAGAAGLDIPNVDGIILVSCAVFSVLITRNIRFSNKINILIVAFFAFFHGFAHGQEISTSASLISYTLGFMLATLLLHGAGILLAKLVVLAITCLLTVLFSSAALAKAGESLIDIKDNSPVVAQFQDADNTDYIPLIPQQPSDGAGSLDFDHSHLTANGLSRRDAGSGGGGFETHRLSTKPWNISGRQTVTDQGKRPAVGDYPVVRVKHHLLNACENPIKQLFYPSYSADCSNLDFKNYYPKINHTPGRHFLSNGVGLTSPPNLFLSLLVLPQFKNTTFSLIEASNPQLSFVRFPIGNFVSKAHSLSNFNALSLATSISGQRHVPNASYFQGLNSCSTLCNDLNFPNSIATDDINNLPCLSVIPIISPFKEFASADQSFFISTLKISHLDRLNRVIRLFKIIT